MKTRTLPNENCAMCSKMDSRGQIMINVDWFCPCISFEGKIS